jgi:hypothetical protein
MAGLNLGIMGSSSVSGSGSGFSSSAPSGGTATEQGFGPGYTQSGTSSTMSALAPDNPAGIGCWAAGLSIIILLVIRHSLPA